MRRLKYLLVIAALAVFAVYAFSAAGQEMFAPGRIDGEHSEHLRKCSKCHVPFAGVPESRCRHCHRRLAQGVKKRTGSHAGFIGPCIGCHRLHGGGKADRLVFDRNLFNHNLTAFGLRGHASVTCRDCHHRRLGPVAVDICRDCHSRGVAEKKRLNAHITALGADCYRCHNGRQKAVYRHKNDDPSFFSGNHDSAACGQCHSRGTYVISKECSSCHDAEHVDYGSNCDRCHTVRDWDEVRFDHQPPLLGGHRNIGCRRCHPSGVRKDDSVACAGCHKFRHKEKTGDDCGRCHSTNGWKELIFDHASADCGRCHQAPAGHFPGNCRQCHATDSWRNASFTHPRIREHSYRSFPCLKCHPDGFQSFTCKPCHRSDQPKDD